MSSFGIAIRDKYIQVVELVSGRGGIRVGSFGEQALPAGALENGSIKDLQAVKDVLKSLKESMNITHAQVAIPDNHVSVLKFRIPQTKKGAIKNAILMELDRTTLAKADDLVFDYDIVHEDGKNMDIHVYASPQMLIEEYLDVCSGAGIEVLRFEPEVHAVARVAIPDSLRQNANFVVNIGDQSTSVAIIESGIVHFVSNFNIGNQDILEKIKDVRKIDDRGAEEIKREQGLMRTERNREVLPLLLQTMAPIQERIDKQFTKWNLDNEAKPDETRSRLGSPGTSKEVFGGERAAIQNIYICGKGATLKGVSEYLSTSLRIKASVSNVWANAGMSKDYIPDISFNGSLSYTTAIGLALGGLVS